MDVKTRRESTLEKTRTADVMRLTPRGFHNMLDVGARDGYFSRLFSEFFEEVTALDIVPMSFTAPRIRTVVGDITNLQFPDRSFDCVFCAEVLEHIPDLKKACSELARVARHAVIIGVPFEQDTRVGRTTCLHCGSVNPPWGHVNEFTEDRLKSLFPDFAVRDKSFVGSTRSKTTGLATKLMDMAGNPWGTYSQIEPCLQCGATLTRPEHRSMVQRTASALALGLNSVQARMIPEQPLWIHVRFERVTK